MGGLNHQAISVACGSGRPARLCGQRSEACTGYLLLVIMVNNELTIVWLEGLWMCQRKTCQIQGKYYNCTRSFLKLQQKQNIVPSWETQSPKRKH